MTPKDLIVDLRDIHTPPDPDAAAALLSPIPLIVFALLLAAGLFWRTAVKPIGAESALYVWPRRKRLLIRENVGPP